MKHTKDLKKFIMRYKSSFLHINVITLFSKLTCPFFICFICLFDNCPLSKYSNNSLYCLLSIRIKYSYAKILAIQPAKYNYKFIKIIGTFTYQVLFTGCYLSYVTKKLSYLCSNTIKLYSDD